MIFCVNKRDGSNMSPMDASTIVDFTNKYFMTDCSGIDIERHDHQTHVAMNVTGDKNWLNIFGLRFAEDLTKMYPLFEVAPDGKYPLFAHT